MSRETLIKVIQMLDDALDTNHLNESEAWTILITLINGIDHTPPHTP